MQRLIFLVGLGEMLIYYLPQPIFCLPQLILIFLVNDLLVETKDLLLIKMTSF